MSKYTTTIKNLMMNEFNFGLDSYPIFDEEYRETLNTKILNHYFESEIGFETPELFKFYLNQKMNEIMPYYNILYSKQETLLKNIEGNVNLKETLERENNTSTHTNSSSLSNSNDKSLFLDTPQGNLRYENIDDDNIHATNLTLNKDDVSDSSNTNGEATGTEKYIKTIIGNNGSKYNYEILNNIKNNIMNIDLFIINDLNELFMGLF